MQKRTKSLLGSLMAALMLSSGLVATAVRADSHICGDAATWDLLAGQNTDAGDVIISNDEENLYIQFVLATDWYMTESHVHVAETMEEIPQNNGNPVPGQFEYSVDHDPAVQSYTYTIPLTDVPNPAVIATHASLYMVDENGDTVATETGWAGDGDFPGGNWALYFSYETQECDPEEPEDPMDPWMGDTHTQGYWKNKGGQRDANVNGYTFIQGNRGDVCSIYGNQFLAFHFNYEAGLVYEDVAFADVTFDSQGAHPDYDGMTIEEISEIAHDLERAVCESGDWSDQEILDLKTVLDLINNGMYMWM